MLTFIQFVKLLGMLCGCAMLDVLKLLWMKESIQLAVQNDKQCSHLQQW